MRAENNLIPRWIVLVESWDDVTPFHAVCRAMLADGTFAEADAPPVLGLYRLQNSRSKSPWSAG